MLKFRTKRVAVDAESARRRLAAVEAAVVALVDDDLLDFADIFAGGDHNPLREIAEAEMRRRGISL